jgi:hypothetical protein
MELSPVLLRALGKAMAASKKRKKELASTAYTVELLTRLRTLWTSPKLARGRP